MRVKLGEVCKVVSGTTPKSSCPEYWNGTLNWVTPAELKDDSDIVYETERKITLRAVQDTGLKPFPIGTVLLSSRAPIGKVAISGTEMYCNQGFKNLVCSGSIYNRYLYHFLKDKTEYLNALGRGATFKEISKDIVENIEIPLPPLETQRHIAAVLDKVSALIALRRQQLDKLDELVKARFVEMFGDPVKSTRWRMRKLSQMGELNRGVSKHRPRNDPALLGGRYPLIQTGDVANAGLFISSFSSTYSELGLKQSRMWQAGTLCITIAANIAKTAILSFDACFPDSIVGFIPSEEISVVFIHYWFSFFQKILEEQAPQVAQKNINLQILSNLDVIVPPADLQNQFAAFVTQTEKTKVAVQQALEKLETLKKALMQEYYG